jgi:hypothetical protein
VVPVHALADDEGNTVLDVVALQRAPHRIHERGLASRTAGARGVVDGERAAKHSG